MDIISLSILISVNMPKKIAYFAGIPGTLGFFAPLQVIEKYAF